MPGPTAVPPALRSRPFTVADAAAYGVTPTMLQGRRYRRLFQGVYVAADVPDSVELRFDGAALLVAGGIASCHTAAELARLPVPPADGVHLRVASGARRPRVNGITIHGGANPVDTDQTWGRPATAPVQTFLDLARHLPLVDLVVYGDALVRRGGTSSGALIQAADEVRAPGAPTARRAARLVRSRVDSPRETMLRLLIVLSGLPEPLVGTDVRDAQGDWLARPDLQYAAVRIAIEYDGEHHRTSRRQWSLDIRRKENLDAEHWRVIVVTAEDLDLRPAVTLGRIHSALLARRYPGVPAQLSGEWRQHFGRRDAVDSRYRVS